MLILEKNYNNTLQSISNCANGKAIKLIAVSKTVPESVIRQLYEIGQRDFGENYAQEFNQKANNLKDLDIVWHFIGNIQSNKTKLISKYAHWVHGLTTAKQAIRLNNDRPEHMGKLNILIEVNISGESSRHGLNAFEDICELSTIINQQPNLTFRGLMGLASATPDKSIINSQFTKLTQIFNQLCQSGHQLDTLSMGMSGDYKVAIEAGSTMVRIGSLIFGERKYD